MKKNDLIELKITDMGVNGEGIGRYEGYAFFVKNAVIGDEVRAVITKMNKGYGFAKALEILRPSSERVVPPCPVALSCGGCQIMQLDYKAQLKYKENKVRENLERIGGIANPPVRPILGMEGQCPLHFRNKVQFPVGRGKDGKAVTGFYAGRTHYIIETENCPVSQPPADELLSAIRQFLDENGLEPYDSQSGNGLIRHVLIRKGTATGQIMVCLVINGEGLPGSTSKKLVSTLTEAFPAIKSICLNINKENTNVILGGRTVCLYGSEYIEDRIGDLTFRVSALSFFQVNGVQTPRLYEKALEYADLHGDETVWDLYCGTGTISLFLARKAKIVYGVEIIQAAIDNANENAQINGIDNAVFYCGKSEEIFPEHYRAAREKGETEIPDVVVLDPPRKGCDPELLEAILDTEPEKIVYVSCDSATLARDIKILSQKYRLAEATPVDMFPHTVHVETVCCLYRRVTHRNNG
ncbi:MAG: 23S rRNA (uracil(1939)-C(5))-methyltransferase RlmD [Lachnospiraceae bacterium]|nr:23S rRNA (uracil(1939)-C(5))-methyltransferase RlmD [Lachnospiraceae bacterium]